MIRVLLVVALPIDFHLLCVLGQELGVLKILLFKIVIAFCVFSLTFGGKVRALFMLNMIALGGMFLFIFVLMFLCFYISWKSFKSGNTVNTEYLNRIPNPEYLAGANVPTFHAVFISI